MRMSALNRDLDSDYPPEARALKDAIADVDAMLFVTPEYNRDIPGALKNAIDWASRPWSDSFARKPSAVIGASPGKIGTAVAQQNFAQHFELLQLAQMNAPEAYIQFTPGLINDDGEVTKQTTPSNSSATSLEQFEQFMGRLWYLRPSRAR